MNNRGEINLFLICAAALLILASSSLTAVAAPLNGNANAITSGTSAYVNGGLFGDIDFAVFTAAAFNAEYPASGYTPNVGELVYAYQLRSGAGSIAATEFSLFLLNPFSNVGTFTGTGVTGVAAAPAVGAAWNSFSAPGNVNTEGLAFSSPNLPVASPFPGTILDGGVTANVFGLQVPGTIAIPEPATLLLALAGLSGITCIRRRHHSP